MGITNVDPNKSAQIDLNTIGMTAESAVGETLTGPEVDSVNTFEKPGTVVPKPISSKARNGKLTLNLEPKSVAVVAVE